MSDLFITGANRPNPAALLRPTPRLDATIDIGQAPGCCKRDEIWKCHEKSREKCFSEKDIEKCNEGKNAEKMIWPPEGKRHEEKCVETKLHRDESKCMVGEKTREKLTQEKDMPEKCMEKLCGESKAMISEKDREKCLPEKHCEKGSFEKAMICEKCHAEKDIEIFDGRGPGRFCPAPTDRFFYQ